MPSRATGFTFTVVPGGSPQTAKIGTAFANPLAVTVTAKNPIEPVNGGRITFVAHPAANGASAISVVSFAVVTNGTAALVAAPNNITGRYTLVGSAPGFSASFHLTNVGTPFAALVVNSTSDSIAPGPGLLSLREAIGFANTAPFGELDHQLRQEGVQDASGDHPDRHPARAEQHDRDRDDRGPEGGSDDQRRRGQPGVPGGRRGDG